MSSEALLALAAQLANDAEKFETQFSESLDGLEERANLIGRSWSGSNLGYHSRVYYEGLQIPPPGAHFSAEWGMMDNFIRETRGDWREMPFEGVRNEVLRTPDSQVLDEAQKPAAELQAFCVEAREQAESILSATLGRASDAYLERLLGDIKAQSILTLPVLRQGLIAMGGQRMSRDSLAVGQGLILAPHQTVLVDIVWRRQGAVIARKLSDLVRRAASHLARSEKARAKVSFVGTNVFIGHGRAGSWRELKDFINGRLGLPYDEFNRVPVAGVTNIARLSEMLDAAAVAFLVMTAEDEQADGTLRARENVVHEVGLFQGRLGFTKAIVLIEEPCGDFSNIQGLGQIRFPAGNISAVFEDVRQVLEREGLIEA